MSIEKRIVIVRDKESIVLRGIEKKFTENGWFVFSCDEDPRTVKGNVERAKIFLLYLPGDASVSFRDSRMLPETEKIIREGGGTKILLGERKHYDDIINYVPAFFNDTWVDRPVDMDKLLELVEDIYEKLKKGESVGAKANAPLGDGTPSVDGVPAGNTSGETASSGFTPTVVSEKKKILIVDDDPAYAKMVREWLKDLYNVNVVVAGMQAITFLMKNRVDLILLDYEMPIVDGPQVFEMLKSEPLLADIPVVFLTGVGTKEGVERVMALRPKGYILKSTTKDELIRYLWKTI